MTKKYWIAVLAVAALAVALRLPRLQMRPMHGDEAVGAYKFGELLEGCSKKIITVTTPTSITARP